MGPSHLLGASRDSPRSGNVPRARDARVGPSAALRWRRRLARYVSTTTRRALPLRAQRICGIWQAALRHHNSPSPTVKSRAAGTGPRPGAVSRLPCAARIIAPSPALTRRRIQKCRPPRQRSLPARPSAPPSRTLSPASTPSTCTREYVLRTRNDEPGPVGIGAAPNRRGLTAVSTVTWCQLQEEGPPCHQGD